MSEDNYGKMLEHKELSSCVLIEFQMQLVMRSYHPLLSAPEITFEDLCQYTETVHGDHRNPVITMSRVNPLLHEPPSRRIYVYDRSSQIDLLKTIPGSYMWASPIPRHMLTESDMILRPLHRPKPRSFDLEKACI